MTQIAREGGVYPAASDLWTRHPDLKAWSNDLSAHLGPMLPGAHGNLLMDCLVDAIASYKKAEADGEDPVGAYVVALLERATDVFDIDVTASVEKGVIAWDPLQQSLPDFCRLYSDVPISVARGKRVVSDEVNGESLLLLGARLLPEYIGRHIVRKVIKRNAQPVS
ncbi:hypothetical protein [Burkholderia sp. Ac-20365]|uniref:hypothetical protein n=1 Tax=Burkholderia sp. Ac-20365 TaxID=2703897 RepID=UPI00197B2B87|nr:hypothetical protein [Burkholderia sp. Ac-20365]